MRKHIFHISVVIISLFLISSASILVSCKRPYEDGPTISFRSRESRVINSWKMTKFYRNDYEYTNDYKRCEFTFEKGGNTDKGAKFNWTVQKKASPTNTDSIAHDTTGTWFLVSKERQASLVFNGDDAAAIGQKTLYINIDRLLEKVMWIRYQIGTDYYFIQLEPK